MTYIPTELSRRIDVNGLAIELETFGAGPTLLYLHAGDGADREAPFLTQLAQHFSIVLPAHPGFGDSELGSGFRAIDDLAYFYLDLLEALDLSNVLLVGSSFGGWLAAEIAVKNTSRIAGLVLAAPLGIKIDDRESRGITDIFSLTPKEQSEHFHAGDGFGLANYRELPEGTLRRIARNREALALFGWSPTLYNPRLQAWLHRIDVPTLVLWGDGDRIVSTDYGRAFCAEIPDAELQVIAGAGHYLPYDAFAARTGESQ
jgi:pimeloyl-ACP methyl ester carboxylesterase